jgi:hypothetical protein
MKDLGHVHRMAFTSHSFIMLLPSLNMRTWSIVNLWARLLKQRPRSPQLTLLWTTQAIFEALLGLYNTLLSHVQIFCIVLILYLNLYVPQIPHI